VGLRLFQILGFLFLSQRAFEESHFAGLKDSLSSSNVPDLEVVIMAEMGDDQDAVALVMEGWDVEDG
jgi:hypothetical protein